MIDLEDRSTVVAQAPVPYGRRATLAAAMASGAWAAAMGLAITTVVVLAAWASSGSALGAAGALRIAASAWLLSMHVGLSIGPLPSIHLGIVPLGLLLVPALLLYRAGQSVARTVGIHGWRDGWLGIGGMAASYAAIAGIVAGMTTSAEVRPAPLQSLLAPWAMAMVFGSLGAMREDRLGRRFLRTLPPTVVACLRAGTAVVIAQLAAAAVLVVGMLLAHLDLATRLGSSLHAGSVGGATLLLLNAVLLVTAIVWALAYLVGTGFSIGTHTGVSPFAHHLGAVPDLPILAAVPSGPSPGWAPMLIAIPVLTGAFAGWWMCARTRELRWWQVPLAGLGIGVVAGILVAALTGMSGGPAGNGRLVTIGPSAWQAGLAVAVEVGAAAALFALVRRAAGPFSGAPRRVMGRARGIIVGSGDMELDLDLDEAAQAIPDPPTRPAPIPPPPPHKG